MNKPLISHRRIDQLRAIASDCGFTSEDAKRFGKLSKLLRGKRCWKLTAFPPGCRL
jgi:hypothetical protein